MVVRSTVSRSINTSVRSTLGSGGGGGGGTQFEGVLLFARNQTTGTRGRILVNSAGETGIPSGAAVRDMVLTNPLCHIGACQKGNFIYFSGPANFDGITNNTERENGIFIRGQMANEDFSSITWDAWQSIDRGEFGYSKSCVLPNGQIGVVYEIWESSGLRFKRFSIDAEPTRQALRSYDFTQASNQLVDSGTDEIDATQTDVTFASGVANFSNATARIDLGTSGEMAWFGRDMWHGVRFDFDGISVPNNGNRQCIIGVANTGTAEIFRVFLDTSVDTLSHDQGRIVVNYRVGLASEQRIYTSAASYAADTPFDLVVDFRGADNKCDIYIGGVLQSVTVASPSDYLETNEALADDYTYPLWLGAWNNRGTVTFPFAGTLQKFRYYGQSKFVTQQASTLVVDEAADTERIPAIVSNSSGHILIAFERRINSVSDDADTDLLLAKSTDNGATFSISTITASSSGSTNQDPCLVYDRNGRLHCYYLTRTGTTSEIYAGTATATWVKKYSDDDGATWSSQTVLDIAVPADWTRVGFGSDGAALLPSGRIIVYGWHVTTSGSSAADGVHFAFYSDDDGETHTLADDWGTSGHNEVVPVVVRR